MKQSITQINKRGSTPSTNQKLSPNITISHKIVVDANQPNQMKKYSIGTTSQYTRTNTNDDQQTKTITKPPVQYIDKSYQQSQLPSNSVFESFGKVQNHLYGSNSQNSPIFLNKQSNSQPSTSQLYGISEQKKIVMGNVGQYPSPQFSHKGDIKKEDIINSDIYKDLLTKYENLADRFQEIKNEKIELVENDKAKDEQIKKIKQDSLKYQQENIILKKKNQDLVKQNKAFRDQLQNQQNEERKDNHDQLLEMVYAIRLHQQEEQMLQMAIQQSAQEVQNDPNFVNVDNMTYEQMLELEEKNGKVSRGLPEEVIAQIPVVNFNARLKRISDKCTICISEFEQGEQLKQLPCKHIYHGECVENWLRQEKKCPVCKGEVLCNQ